MIAGIPNYSDSPIQSLRCVCGLRYVVLVGSGEHEQTARAEAERLQASFVDARRLLAFDCYCGECLDVSLDAAFTVQ
jgi:hypothetical protein